MPLTEFPVADTRRFVGRPPLNEDSDTKPTMVRLTASTRARIAAVVGPNRMAVFIREAIEAELKRRETDAPS